VVKEVTTNNNRPTNLSAYIRPRKLTDRALNRMGGSFEGEITSVRVDRVKNKTTEKFEWTPVLVFGDSYETYPTGAMPGDSHAMDWGLLLKQILARAGLGIAR
jgi:hypothetical protein